MDEVVPIAIDISVQVDSEGRIPRSRMEWLLDYLKLYAGGEVRIRIGKPKRSTRANSYYWGYVLETVRKTMYEVGLGPVDAEVLHDLFKRRYLTPRTEVVFGRDETFEPSTKDMDSTAFHDYLEAIKNDEDVRMLGIYWEEEPMFSSYAIAEEA